MRFLLAPALALACSISAAQAEERREHAAHEHGHAVMRVVLEDAVLAIELEAPGMDIVGFEHAPEGPADEAKIKAALAKLENAGAMFMLPQGAACTVNEAHAEHGGLEDDDHDSHADHKDHDGHKDHDDHKDHKADDHHKHDADKDHADHKDHGDHKAHDGEEDSHSAFHAHYEWRCANPSALKNIAVKYFDHFPRTEEIDAMILGPNGQTAQELNSGAAEIKF